MLLLLLLLLGASVACVLLVFFVFSRTQCIVVLWPVCAFFSFVLDPRRNVRAVQIPSHIQDQNRSSTTTRSTKQQP